MEKESEHRGSGYLSREQVLRVRRLGLVKGYNAYMISKLTGIEMGRVEGIVEGRTYRSYYEGIEIEEVSSEDLEGETGITTDEDIEDDERNV